MQENTHGASVCAPSLRNVWSEYKQTRRLSEKTIKVYEQAMKWGFSDWLDRPVSVISKNMVEIRHRQLSEHHGPRGKGEAAANQCMRVLRALLHYALYRYETEDGRALLPGNPVRRLSEVRAWNKSRRRRGVLLPYQLKAWFAAVMRTPNTTIRDYLLLLLFMGLRRNEAARLKWQDIDLDGAVLTARRKGAEMHTLPIPQFILSLLRARYDYVRPRPDDWLFPGRITAYPLSATSKAYEAVTKTCGVEFMLHDLRRTFLTLAESVDLKEYTIKSLANHKPLNDVTAGYLIISPERLREPMERIAAEILRLTGEQ